MLAALTVEAMVDWSVALKAVLLVVMKVSLLVTKMVIQKVHYLV